MQIKIELEFPYTQDYITGYLREQRGRRYVSLYMTGKPVTITSYARYLMSVKLKRYLTDDEEVDHKDKDRYNDCISNLQVLTKEEHLLKTLSDRGHNRRLDADYVCPICGEGFTSSDPGRKYCSKECSSKGLHRFDIEIDELIELLMIHPFTKVGEMFGVSDNAIRKRLKAKGIDPKEILRLKRESKKK